MLKLTVDGAWWKWIAVVVGMLVSTGAGAMSYLKTAQHTVTESVRDAVPIGFELERVAQLTRELIPDIQASQKVAAQLETEVEYLQKEVKTISDQQDAARSQMEKLRAALEQTCETGILFGGKSFTKTQIEEDLERRLERYEQGAIQLQSREKLLATRRQTLGTAIDKIAQYRRSHDVLIERCEGLKAELRLAELASDAHQIDFDHSKVAAAKSLADEVEKKIRTIQRLVDRQSAHEEIPVDSDADKPIAAKFDEYFETSFARSNKSQSE